MESLRAAIEAEVTAYALNHYRHGVSATFSKPTEVAYKKMTPYLGDVSLVFFSGR